MTIFLHELRQNRTSFLLWTLSILFLILVCVFLYPEIKKEAASLNDAFASMGSFSQAFGMDQLSFGTLTGFYAVECGNIAGLGGALYAALTGCSMLAKEEKNKTADFLLSHGVSRTAILTQKLAALIVMILVMNAIIFGAAISSVAMIGETIPWKELLLLHGACLLMQLETACLCFGLSAFITKGSAGAGLSIAMIFYFTGLMAKMSDKARFLKYLTPFGYCDGARIVSDQKLDMTLIILGLVLAAAGTILAYGRYCRKDIHA